MRCLIRNITRKRSGIQHEDKAYTADTLTIGRAAAHNIFLSDLRVALNHAKITRTPDGKFQIQAQALSGVRVNGETTGMAIIAIGDVVSIGACRIEVVKAPQSDIDLCLEVEQPKAGAEETATLQNRSTIGLENTSLKKRLWSWVLVLAVFGIFLVAPLAGFMVEGLREPLRATGILSDQVWDTGELANVHHFIGKDCNACHQKAFTMVEDDACVACHTKVSVHADPTTHPVPELTDTRCGKCHKEHNAPSSLSRLNDPLCVACHADIQTIDPATTLLDATHFEDQHPEFKVTLFKSDRSGDTIRVAVVGDEANLVETSGLRFDHKVHLRSEGISAPDGKRKLDCGSCHQTEPGGVGMAPVTMKDHCQDCHRLEFEPNDRDRVVPHADIAAVVHTLKEYYAARALNGGYLEEQGWAKGGKAAPDKARAQTNPSTPDVVSQRRRPGQEMTDGERKQALEWANEKWVYVAEEMFEFRACTTCHIVKRGETEEPSWVLEPVRVADQWLPKGIFPHDRHSTTACVACHTSTPLSEQSEDVLIPAKASCTVCHGGPDERNKLASQCVDCHKFHVLDSHFMGPAKAASM
ncbi:MAG: FHA domain-containing protein [Chromatiales bacterium]|jgi:predicted CXXCH cytochrome family protein|nr:FHA domain-containing protein [Chromatiales bacterium]